MNFYDIFQQNSFARFVYEDTLKNGKDISLITYGGFCLRCGNRRIGTRIVRKGELQEPPNPFSVAMYDMRFYDCEGGWSHFGDLI